MKIQLVFGFYILFAFSIVALVMAKPEYPENSSTPKPCVKECPEARDPVCGYDSTCYSVFHNKCKYDHLKCTAKNNLETVDMSLCELADRRTHPHYRLC